MSNRACPTIVRIGRRRLGWGNDADGHVQIVAVVDPETGRVWSPRRWAARCVWRWTTRYEVN